MFKFQPHWSDLYDLIKCIILKWFNMDGQLSIIVSPSPSSPSLYSLSTFSLRHFLVTIFFHFLKVGVTTLINWHMIVLGRCPRGRPKPQGPRSPAAVNWGSFPFCYVNAVWLALLGQWSDLLCWCHDSRFLLTRSYFMRMPGQGWQFLTDLQVLWIILFIQITKLLIQTWWNRLKSTYPTLKIWMNFDDIQPQFIVAS